MAEGVVKRLIDSGKTIASSYHEWLRVGFAIAEKFGENGRSLFHELSNSNCTNGKSQNPRTIDAQYTQCLRAKSSGVTFATIVHLAKQAGVTVYDERQKAIVQSAVYGKKNKVPAGTIVKQLSAAEGITGPDVERIVNEVFQRNDNLLAATQEGETMPAKIRTHLNETYEIRRNEITGKIEVNGEDMTDIIFNDMLLDLQEFVDEDIEKKHLQVIINSSFVQPYDAFREFLVKNNSVPRSRDLIKNLANAVTVAEVQQPFWVSLFEKWLVAGVRMWLGGEQTPLTLVLQSFQQGLGKTYFFRNILPPELQKYYSEAPLIFEHKDDYIRLSTNLILMDDEFEGKSKKEEKHFKMFSDIKAKSIRRTWAVYEEQFRRRALLCGTANATDILSDPTGNRRIIPISVIAMDHKKYNSIDKAALWMAAYELALDETFDSKILLHDMPILSDITTAFKSVDIVEELLYTYFSKDKKPGYKRDVMSVSEILNYLQMKATFRNLSERRLSQLISAGKFELAKRRASEDRRIKKYIVYVKDENSIEHVMEKQENSNDFEF